MAAIADSGGAVGNKYILHTECPTRQKHGILRRCSPEHHSGPSITHLMTKLPSLSFPAFVTSNASSASVNLKVWVNKGFKSTRPRATRSMARGLDGSQ